MGRGLRTAWVRSFPRPLSVCLCCSSPTPDRCFQGFSCPLLSVRQLGLDTHAVSALHGQHSSPLSHLLQFYRGLLEQSNVHKVPRRKSYPLLTRLNFMDCRMSWNATDPILAYLYKPLQTIDRFTEVLEHPYDYQINLSCNV